MDELLASVIEVAKRHVTGADPVAVDRPDVELRSVGLGSLKLVEFMVDLERTFGVRFPEELVDAATFRTPRTVAEAIAAIRTG